MTFYQHDDYYQGKVLANQTSRVFVSKKGQVLRINSHSFWLQSPSTSEQCGRTCPFIPCPSGKLSLGIWGRLLLSLVLGKILLVQVLSHPSLTRVVSSCKRLPALCGIFLLLRALEGSFQKPHFVWFPDIDIVSS